MKKLILILFIAVTVCLFACSKDKMQGTHHVQIRVVNTTSTLVSDAVLGGEIYGSILPGQTSAYHDFDNITYTPKLSFYNDKALVELLIGVCGTPPFPEPSYIEEGKYIYTVVNDSSWPQGFSYTFTKE